MDWDGILGGLPTPESVSSEFTAFIRHQIQSIFQSTIWHLVQQISEYVVGIPRLRLPSTSSKGDEQAHLGMEGHQEPHYGIKREIFRKERK